MPSNFPSSSSVAFSVQQAGNKLSGDPGGVIISWMAPPCRESRFTLVNVVVPDDLYGFLEGIGTVEKNQTLLPGYSPGSHSGDQHQEKQRSSQTCSFYSPSSIFSVI